MNSLSDGLASAGVQKSLPPGSPGAGALFPIPLSEGSEREGGFELLEFRSLSDDDVETMLEAGTLATLDTTGEDTSARDAVTRDGLDAARKEGFQAGEREGQRIAQERLEGQSQARVDRERERLAVVVQDFGTARERYFGDVEQEVVKLALAIAARVLHREAQMDPLLLMAAVRVALEKMADRSSVVLRSSHAEVEAWERVFQATEPTERPRVVSDALLERGDCVLETKLGTVELGVRIQLEEIEKGFFDLLNHRPGR